MIIPLIAIEKLRVIYNQGKPNEMRALEETNIDIFPREYIIIHGPSGCGKSTLLYSIAGLQKPTYGDITIGDIRFSTMTTAQELTLHQTGIGMIFQAFYLIPSLTIIDNVCLPKTFRGENLKARKAEGMRFLRRFGIAEQADKFPNQLSGGQKQRVAIARALVNNPDIILADEPVGNLDSESAQNVLTILKELNDIDKKTIILVTHNPEHLIYADRILHMKDGMVISEEVRRDKRPEQVIVKEITEEPDEAENELSILMHSFKNLSTQQMNVLLIPFKAKQLLNHVLAELTEEQTTMAESFLKEVLIRNITTDDLATRLDVELDQGGAGWNKKRARSFAGRIQSVLEQVYTLQTYPSKGYLTLTDYLIQSFNLHFNEEAELRFQTALRLRADNKINSFELRHKFDTPSILGGVGLYKTTAEKIVREVEIIMLLKY